MELFVELFALAATIPVSTSVERALDTSFRAMPSAKNIVTSRRDIRAIQAGRNPNHAKARGDERYRTELVSDLIQYVSNALESAALLGSLSCARERKGTGAAACRADQDLVLWVQTQFLPFARERLPD